MKRGRANLLLAVFLLTQSTVSGARPTQPITVHVAYPPIIASLPYYIIKEQPPPASPQISWEEVGITSSNDMLNALVAGRVDILPAVSLIPVIHLEIASPGRVRLFSHSRMTASRAFDSIIVPASFSGHSLSDLRGKRIGVFPGTSARKLLATFLVRNGIQEADVTFVSLEPQAQLGALRAGSIDALYSYEPTTSIGVRSGCRKLYGSVYAALLDKNPIGCSVISRAFERANPRAAKTAIRSIDEAVLYMRRNEGQARTLLSKYTKIDPAIAFDANIVDVTLEREVDAAKLQQFIDLLYAIGEIPERIDAKRLL